MQVQADPTATTIVIGEGTEEMHLNTFEDLECVSCTRPFFSGQTLAESPVYALVTEYKVIQTCRNDDPIKPVNFGKLLSQVMFCQHWSRFRNVENADL